MNKTQSDKPSAQICEYLLQLIEQGIPVKTVVCHKTVPSYTGEPEYAYYDKPGSAKPSRIAEMWLVSPGVIIKQGERFVIVPHANVAYTIVK